MITFRNCSWRDPFLWEVADQPASRWNHENDGPVQYLADTPDGAWAEFLRHEEIVDEIDLAGVRRALWAIDIDVDSLEAPALPLATMTGDPSTYPDCQAEARRLRNSGASGIAVPSAALVAGSAAGYHICGGFQEGAPRDGRVYVLFGVQPDAVGWVIVDEGRPPVEILDRVRHF
ncbi:RES family NAD+ phosphorylase [Kocuria marina]|uniref:RES family NAD+ phosphorylase n=1 Tax=Kocuria marina TaxID=223184 RepID=UPI0019D15DB2|nr:RES family NAD+ phosphorylase [Kocuria indica]MBN6812942.1 RES family NAD+ phosphorylase [Kocuria indica]MBN6844667.1 RES family NAD+ phosphorylase [Kocuria indica]